MRRKVVAEPEEPEESAEDCCPLLGENNVPLAGVVDLKIYRVERDDDGRDTGLAWVVSLPPTATIEDLAHECGGGTYDVRPFNKRYLAGGLRIKIEGKSRGMRGMHGGIPVSETASGLAMVAGLDPAAQVIFAIMQQQLAQTREDARYYAESLTVIVREAVKRAEPSLVSPDVALMTAQLERAAISERELRAQLATGAGDALKLQIAKLRLEKGSGAQEILLTKLAESTDGALGLFAQWLAKREGLDVPQIVEKIAERAPLAAP